MAKLDGKVAIITGGGNGIGRAYCQRFATEGASVVVADLDESAAARVASAIVAEGVRARAAAVDVSVNAQVNNIIEQALNDFGQIDILVNNAGIYPWMPFEEITEDLWSRVIDVNLKGTFLCSQAASRHMSQRRTGKIINIASGTVVSGHPGCVHYVASKAGVIGLTRSMARALGTYGINVNCIAPGLTNTETVLAGLTQDDLAFFRGARAIQRDECAEDLVGAAVFLASADSDFITGQTLVVDGGRVFL